MAHVIQLTDLDDFISEVPLKPMPVRVLLSQVNEFEEPGIIRTQYHLDVTGINRENNIVWFHWSIALEHPVIGGWFCRFDQDKHDLLPAIKTALTNRLVDEGYFVRAGRYGIKSNIQPVVGDIKIIFVPDTDGDGLTLEYLY